MMRSTGALLALDTSTETLSIVVAGPRGERSWNGPGGAQASARLLPQALVLLQEAGLAWADLEAIAFGAGPGAFTGLRTACAVAQGLALGIGCGVIAIDSLLIVAEDAGADEGPIWVAMDARMDEVYGAEYRRAGDDWETLRAPALYTLAALRDVWSATPPLQIAGSAPAAFGARLSTPGAALLPTERDRAAALLRLARRRDAVDAALALPVYLRDKVAQTSAERAAARASS